MMEDIYTFEEGLFGFENLKKFVFTGLNEDTENIFRHMVSLDNPDIGFIVVPPHQIYNHYDIDVDDFELEKIGVLKPEDIIVLSIVILSKVENKIYVNLKSPIILSVNSKKGKQIILDDNRYETRYAINLPN